MTDIVSFVRRWNASTLTERSAYQQHFRDLCEALDVPYPTQEDQTDANYTYEKHVTKAGTGESGFADVWKRGWFAWEYKSKGGDLKKAYKQLNEYHEALENPPLLIVCDFVRFEVHTKFENAPPRVYAFTLDDLLHDRDTATCALPPIEVLRHVFGDYNQLRPGVASARVTEAAASDFLRLAKELELEKAIARERPSKEQIAHFLMRLVFCLFADSVGLLPNHTFRTLIKNDRQSPLSFNRKLPVLFQAMSEEHGFFGADNIPYFNGGLFSDNSTIELNHADLGILYSASQHDWSHIEPAIFGTLFERSLDAAKRSMIGAHYTSTEDILLLIEPVVMDPLRRRWDAVKASVLAALAEEQKDATPNAVILSEGAASHPAPKPKNPEAASAGKKSKTLSGKTLKSRPVNPALILNRPALILLQDWAAELSAVRILDPACGSGNFLYVALKRLLDLWHEARVFAIEHGLTITLDPMPNPGQLFGIEIDFYAHEIASVVVWIGFLQWKHDHGIKDDKSPLLQKLTNIEHDDAIMRLDAKGQPYEPAWPQADYIVGNPPFLGGNRLRNELGDVYVDDLFELYKDQVAQFSDLVVYWFEKARRQLETNRVQRVGLLATQGIRGGANRAVLERIQQIGTIFWAWSDRAWTLAGAAVRVSMVAFEGKDKHEADIAETAITLSAEGAPHISVGQSPTSASEKDQRAGGLTYLLDGQPVPFINPDLTSGTNTAAAIRLNENEGLCFMGPSPKGEFDITDDIARKMLTRPLNINGRPNSDVIRPVISGVDIVRRPRNMWTIDFGIDREQDDAAMYEMPFEYLRTMSLPKRATSQREEYRQRWWLYGRPRPEMRDALKGKRRFIATPATSKYRLFVWLGVSVLSNQGTLVFAREDDYFFGVLHSSIHEFWARAQGTQLREVESGFRYTPNSTFDTFPFPYPPGTEPSEADSPIVKAIADAARTLVQFRDNWLNPTPLPPADELKNRTLTKLYNERPTWLANAHRQLDEAVFAAYGWPSDLTHQEILAGLLALNHERAAAQG